MPERSIRNTHSITVACNPRRIRIPLLITVRDHPRNIAQWYSSVLVATIPTTIGAG
jgi:hypothetical protein